ncbi:MAG: 50S ribosomal protein L21 [Patescibacteria group bacterium]|nr:50S ribosomal protein L21 [Patescibacteria group bacterium]
MKFAVIKTGGKQYKVSEGDVIKVEKLKAKPKEKITFKDVYLLVDGTEVEIGQPLVKGVKVTAQVLDQQKDKKIRVVKFKAKSKYRRVQGHRQRLTVLKILKIT